MFYLSYGSTIKSYKTTGWSTFFVLTNVDGYSTFSQTADDYKDSTIGSCYAANCIDGGARNQIVRFGKACNI